MWNSSVLSIFLPSCLLCLLSTTGLFLLLGPGLYSQQSTLWGALNSIRASRDLTTWGHGGPVSSYRALPEVILVKSVLGWGPAWRYKSRSNPQWHDPGDEGYGLLWEQKSTFKTREKELTFSGLDKVKILSSGILKKIMKHCRPLWWRPALRTS